MIEGISHLTLAVKGLDISFNFYLDVLELKPLMKTLDGAYFLAGNLWFYLSLAPNARTSARPEYTNFTFAVSEVNFESLSEKIKMSGAKV